jgi:putative membrane protein
VYFAAERTLLAWIRTGLAIMAFGFVVARFGLFLRLLEIQAQSGISTGHPLSPLLGATLVLVGVVVTGFGGVQYRRYCARLPREDMPSRRATSIPLALVVALVLAGLALAWTLRT